MIVFVGIYYRSIKKAGLDYLAIRIRIPKRISRAQLTNGTKKERKVKKRLSKPKKVKYCAREKTSGSKGKSCVFYSAYNNEILLFLTIKNY